MCLLSLTTCACSFDARVLPRSVLGEADGTMSEFVVQSSDTFLATSPEALAGFDVGDEASPAFGDFTGDGITDLVVGSARGGLRAFPNHGTESRTNFAWPVEISIETAGTRTVPTMGDLNADGLLDLVVGRNDGTLRCFRNAGVDQLAERTPAAFVPWEDTQINPTEGIEVTARSAPFLFDVNRDGLLDLLVGSALGDIQLFLNQGSAIQPTFARVGVTLLVSVYGPSVPAVMPAVIPISVVVVRLPTALRSTFGEQLILRAAASNSVASFKAQVESFVAIPTCLQQLSFGSFALSDGTRSLGSYGVNDGGMVVLMLNGTSPLTQSLSTLTVLMPELFKGRLGSSLTLAFNVSNIVSDLATLVESATGVDISSFALSQGDVLLTDSAATLSSYSIADGSTVSLLFNPLIGAINIALPAALHQTLGKKITLAATAMSTVASIKAQIESLAAIPRSSQHLRFSGTTLTNGTCSIGSYGVTDGSTLFLILEPPTLLIVGSGDGTVHAYELNSTYGGAGIVAFELAGDSYSNATGLALVSSKPLSPEGTGVHLRDSLMDGIVLRLTLPASIDGFDALSFMRQVQQHLDSVMSGMHAEMLSLSVASVDVTFLVRSTAQRALDVPQLLGAAQAYACALYQPGNQSAFSEHQDLSTFLQGPGLRHILVGGVEKRLPCQRLPNPPPMPSQAPLPTPFPLLPLSPPGNRSFPDSLSGEDDTASAASLTLVLLLFLLGPCGVCCCCIWCDICCCRSRQHEDTERAYVKLWVRASETSRPEAIDPLVYRLVNLSLKMAQFPHNQHHLCERPFGLLVQLATEREEVPPSRLRRGLHAPVLTVGDRRNISDLVVPEDHQLVSSLMHTSSSAAPLHTTLRDVVLHGRGWYGESVLHLLLLASEREAPSVYRRTIEWLLQTPPGEEDQHSETGLTHGDLRLLVNARYDGPHFLGQTPLHIAAARGDVPMAELLLSRGAEADSPCASSPFTRKRGIGSTPISFAVSAGHRSMVTCLLERGAAHIDHPIDATIIHQPMSTDIEMHMGLREQVSAVATLHAVHREWCARGEVQPSLQPSGAQGTNEVEPPRRAAIRGSTLLHCAVLHNRVDIYRALISMGASPHVRDASGKSPLLLAAAFGSEEIFAIALGSVSSREWASGRLQCVRFPLNEMDTLFRYEPDGDDMQGHQEVIGNNGHKTVLEHIACRGRNELLRSPQVGYAACLCGYNASA